MATDSSTGLDEARRPWRDALAEEMAALARDLAGNVLIDLPRIGGQG